ncbi:hypothetical protein MNO11_15355 [Serratia plymuthica]|uniref:hypothetical protein n=1 Tax=Serratia plymuthica TaxID=82996 RepID=UPI001F5332BD|nr:hypothetical protein [Serratia plymuthica]UNK26222.1 hypothetical protein MNO11_15355 [Serratia plymuthica]
MAKKDQDNELGGLPPELLVGDQESQETLKDEDQDDDNSGDTDTDTDTDTDGDSDQESNSDVVDDGLVTVVVTKGNTVRHDGQSYPENRTLTLSAEDALRLIGKGVAADVEHLRKLALMRTAPAVSVKSEE